MIASSDDTFTPSVIAISVGTTKNLQMSTPGCPKKAEVSYFVSTAADYLCRLLAGPKGETSCSGRVPCRKSSQEACTGASESSARHPSPDRVFPIRIRVPARNPPSSLALASLACTSEPSRSSLQHSVLPLSRRVIWTLTGSGLRCRPLTTRQPDLQAYPRGSTGSYVEV